MFALCHDVTGRERRWRTEREARGSMYMEFAANERTDGCVSLGGMEWKQADGEDDVPRRILLGRSVERALPARESGWDGDALVGGSAYWC